MEEYYLGRSPGGVFMTNGQFMYVKKPFKVNLPEGETVEFAQGGYLLMDNERKIRGAVSKETIEKGLIKL